MHLLLNDVSVTTSTISTEVVTLHVLGTCESAVCVRIEYELNKKRCTELQIPHSNPQTH